MARAHALSSTSWKLLLLLLFVSLAGDFGPTGAQTATQIVRPTAPDTAVSNFLNPGNARDNSTFSAAGTSIGRVCNANCNTPLEGTATWGNFGAPGAAYRPTRLEVQWSAGSLPSIGASATIVHTIEYSLGSGWQVLEQRVWNSERSLGCPTPSDKSITCPDHVAPPLSLSPTQDLSQLQVRATVRVELQCGGQCVPFNFNNASATMSVYDIRVITEVPTLAIVLDADNNFDAGAPFQPQNDQPTYVPGDAFPSKTPRAVPTGTDPIDTVKVIAAFVLSDGRIAPPPSGVGSVIMTVTNPSNYDGISMNYLPGYTGDLAMPQSSVPFGSDNTARADLEVRDYAARGLVSASSGTSSATLSIPLDIDGNGIPDVGWQAADLTNIPDRIATEDSDAEPTGDGTAGDGLSSIEEYRGVVVNGSLRRLNPLRKDLFFYSEHPQFIGDAVNLPVNIHLLQPSEISVGDRIVNRYYANAGHGGDLRSAAGFQRALRIIEAGFNSSGVAGRMVPLSGLPFIPSPPNDVLVLEIYSDVIRAASPPNSSTTQTDPFDEPKMNQTLAHEIGHGIKIPHWQPLPTDLCGAPNFPSRNPTVMITCWLTMPSRWQSIPHNYDGIDLSGLRIKK